MLSCLVWSASCGVVVAQTPIDLPAQPSEHFDTALPEKHPNIAPPQAPSQPSNEPSVRHISSQDLRHNPELLQRALDSAIMTRNEDAVRLLAPIYNELDDKDEILAQYAQARVAQADGKTQQAIALYENIVAQKPEAAPVRFDLVQTLLQDSRHHDAKKHIALLQKDENLPQEINNVLIEQQAYLRQQHKWRLSGSLNYIQEDNINNAPKQSVLETETGTWRFSPPEKARGVSYDFAADKKTPLKGNWSAQLGVQAYGKHYPQKHSYNDLNLGVSAGVSHRNIKREWRITPLAEKRWFGGKPYSQQYGLRVQHNRALNRKWHSFSSVRAAYTQHKHRDFLDGSSFSASQSFQYQVNPRNTLIVGADLLRENARDKSSASFRQAARVGWVNRWKGLETSVHLTASTRRYDSADWFLNQRRKDREYSSYLTLAHNKIQWRGFMPKLAWRASKQNSNHVLYRYRKQQVFVELDKAF